MKNLLLIWDARGTNLNFREYNMIKIALSQVENDTQDIIWWAKYSGMVEFSI